MILYLYLSPNCPVAMVSRLSREELEKEDLLPADVIVREWDTDKDDSLVLHPAGGYEESNDG